MRLAAIDIGSNSIKLVVVDASSPDAFAVLAREKETVRLGQMEQLRADLPGMLEAVGQPIDHSLRHYINTAPALNSSRHGEYVEYYDAASMTLVAERDRSVIDRHEYRFGREEK